MSGGGSGDGPGVDLWILSFSDCMVNLMAFFVMMLTFSSTSHSPRTRAEGNFSTPGGNTLLEESKEPQGSMVEGVERVTDFTENGSEKPTEHDAVAVRNPKESPAPLVGADAYRGRHDVAISGARLFWGQGTVLQPSGRDYLKLLSGYLAKTSNPVVVSAGPSARDLERARAVVEALRAQTGAGAERFGISAAPAPRSGRGADLIGITILSGSRWP